jgi:hypothetical protein
MRYAVVLLIGLVVLEPGLRTAIGARQAPRSEARAGQVRLDGRAVADAAGPFNALGATLFWGAWAYKFDRARLERNLEVLGAAGVDYIRVLGSVGGATWEDRQTDPRWKDYDAIIAGMTDLAYDRYGMRVQWTIFGGAPFTPAGRARERLVDRFAVMARGREHKIFAFEIANEAWQNGFRGRDGLDELRRLGKRLNRRTPVLVALSSPAARAACETYAGAGANVMTLHYDRNSPPEDPSRPLRLPWSYPDAYDEKCRGQLPVAVLNNEPIGPESSVQQDDSPERIAAAYVMTFLGGNASYVLHTGPGIRGGGAADVSGKIRRHAHFDELPAFESIAAALGAAKTYMPDNLANWMRHAPDSATGPLHGFEHLYLASNGKDVFGLALDVQNPVTLTARSAMSFEVRQTATAKLVKQFTLKSGEHVTLRAAGALVLAGRVQ